MKWLKARLALLSSSVPAASGSAGDGQCDRDTGPQDKIILTAHSNWTMSGACDKLLQVSHHTSNIEYTSHGLRNAEQFEIEIFTRHTPVRHTPYDSSWNIRGYPSNTERTSSSTKDNNFDPYKLSIIDGACWSKA